MKKILFVAAMFAVAVSASAQFAQSSSKKSVGGGDDTYPTGFHSEVNAYLGNGWGAGYQLRRDFNQYLGWDVLGFSYMSGFKVGPGETGTVNFRVLGVRGYTPSYQGIVRGYADLNMGYTLNYVVDWGCNHNFGLDFGVGVQILKDFAIGYNMNVAKPNGGIGHYAKISYLF